MYKFFESFLKKMRINFLCIVKATRNEVSIEDLHSDAWILANTIGKRRGREIDFSDPLDESLIIRAVNSQNVKQGDWTMRKAIRIDKEPEEDENAPRWYDKIAARDSSDPIIVLLHRESALTAETLFINSFSQAVAYTRMFMHFKNSRQEACDYLAISSKTLTNRVTCAAQTVRIQPSLFDRIERIAESFFPLAGRLYTSQVEQRSGSVQLGWEF